MRAELENLQRMVSTTQKNTSRGSRPSFADYYKNDDTGNGGSWAQDLFDELQREKGSTRGQVLASRHLGKNFRSNFL